MGVRPVPAPAQQDTNAPLVPVPSSSSSEPAPAKRRSKFDMAKTFSVVVPEDKKVKALIDKTAEFVVAEGWEFEKLLLDRERQNAKFAFMSQESAAAEDPLHIYYRWKTFSLAQGD